MQDLKKSKRRLVNKHMSQVAASLSCDEAINENISRGCKCGCGCNPCNNTCNDVCTETCQIDSEQCFKNNCGPDCCKPISLQIPSVSCAIPYVIEANRVFDTMQFQTFTDAQAPGGEPISYIYDIIEVNGPLPKGGQMSVNIDKICVNYSSIRIKPGCTTLEDYEMNKSNDSKHGKCETIFDYDVCGERKSQCCSKGKGKSVVYKERCLTVVVEDLVLELIGKCGCTTFKALAYPAYKCCHSSQVKKLDKVEFIFNTLTAPICVPADGRGFTLRQDFRTNVTVDCIGKAILKFIDCDECECYYEFCIPNEIDVVLCLQEIVSILVSEQIVVLGSDESVEPRIVDTFAKVCDFSKCGE